MRRESRIVLTTLALGALWAGGSRVLEALPSLDAFRVTDVEITGVDFLDRGEVLRVLGVTWETSVLGDTGAWERRLLEHPLVEAATVERRLPGTLVVSIRERRPVALAPTPTLEPVDEKGVRLPIDPAVRRLDLPVLEIGKEPAPGSRLLPARSRALAAEVRRLQEADTAFLQMVSEVAWQDRNTLVARWSEPRVDFLLTPGAPPRRLREGLAVLADALAREPDRIPTVIDLRYADQVVVRRTP